VTFSIIFSLNIGFKFHIKKIIKKITHGKDEFLLKILLWFFLQYPISNFILGIFVPSTVFIVRLCRVFTGFTKTLTNSSFHVITSSQEPLY